jgi:hypothetical protein
LTEQAEGPPEVVLTDIDVLCHAAEYGLVTIEEVERWCTYLEVKAADDEFAAGCAENTVNVVPSFIADATKLESVLLERNRHVSRDRRQNQACCYINIPMPRL